MPTGKNSTLCQRVEIVAGYTTTNAATAANTATRNARPWRSHQLTQPRHRREPHAAGPAETLAEDAGRTEHQHEHEHREREHVLPLAAENGRPPVLEQTEEQTAQERAADVPDATEHGRGERLDAGQEADVVTRALEEQPEQRAARASEHPAEQERQHDDPVDVHAHQRGGAGVLRGGADAPAEPGGGHEAVERHHQDERGHDHEQLVAAHARPAEVEELVAFEHAGEAQLVAAVAQREQLLEEQRDPDGGDERRQPLGAPASQRAGRPPVP